MVKALTSYKGRIQRQPYIYIWGSARENWAFAIFFKFSNLTVFGYRKALSTKQFLRIQNWTVYHRATKR